MERVGRLTLENDIDIVLQTGLSSQYDAEVRMLESSAEWPDRAWIERAVDNQYDRLTREKSEAGPKALASVSRVVCPPRNMSVLFASGAHRGEPFAATRGTRGPHGDAGSGNRVGGASGVGGGTANTGGYSLEPERPEKLLEPPELTEMQEDVGEPEMGLGTFEAEQRDAPAALRKLRNSFTGDLYPVLLSRTRYTFASEAHRGELQKAGVRQTRTEGEWQSR